MKISQLWKESENTANKRKALTAKNYPKYCTQKLDDKCIVLNLCGAVNIAVIHSIFMNTLIKTIPNTNVYGHLKDARMPIKGNGIREFAEAHRNTLSILQQQNT